MIRNNLSCLEEVTNYRSNHSDSYLIVDTNVLLLLLVGIYDKAYLKECSLMKENGKCYGEEHFELMKKILGIFLYRVVITPHILSEINMHSKRISSGRFEAYFSRMLEQLERFKEHYVSMEILSKNDAIIRFGFTDISLVEVAKSNKWVILTDEFQLKRTFSECLPIIYFTNIVTSELMLK